MPRFAVILIALALAACGRQDPVLGFEASQAKLTQHRKAYEWLAADVRVCGLLQLKAVGQPEARCAGKGDKARLQTAMQTLGVLEARITDGDVWLMTGTDFPSGQSMAVPVASWMIQTREAGSARPNPLTPAPSQWFYETHD